MDSQTASVVSAAVSAAAALFGAVLTYLGMVASDKRRHVWDVEAEQRRHAREQESAQASRVRDAVVAVMAWTDEVNHYIGVLAAVRDRFRANEPLEQWARALVEPKPPIACSPAERSALPTGIRRDALALHVRLQEIEVRLLGAMATRCRDEITAAWLPLDGAADAVDSLRVQCEAALAE